MAEKFALVIHCEDCIYSRPMPYGVNDCDGEMLRCICDPANPLRSVWADSTCDDAEERDG